MVRVFCKKSIYWNLSDVFLVIRLGSRVIGRKTTEVKCYFHHILSREHTINMIYDLDHLEEVVCQVSPL